MVTTCAPVLEVVRYGSSADSVLKCAMVLMVNVREACSGKSVVGLVGDASRGRAPIVVAALLIRIVGDPNYSRQT